MAILINARIRRRRQSEVKHNGQKMTIHRFALVSGGVRERQFEQRL
jgi:hypothetical protein